MSLYDDITPESIKADIIANYQGSLDTRDGSFFDLLISPLAWELYKNYKSQEAVLSIAFPDETSGVWLDVECAKYGIVRKAGTYATATVTFTGTAGTILPAGTAFLTEDGREYLLEATVTLTGGSDTGSVKAVETGTQYNAAAGIISQMYNSVPGLTSFSAGEAADGTDDETNAALMSRLDTYRKNPSSSGNPADYISWAMSVDGVGAAYVIPEWNGAGTVKVIVASPAGGTVTQTVISAVAAYIESQRPIGATVTVASATEQEISVTATLQLDGTLDFDDVSTAILGAIAEYLSGIGVGGGTVSYNKIAYLMLDTPGVADYSGLTVGGGTASITLQPGTSAALGTVSLSEASA